MNDIPPGGSQPGEQAATQQFWQSPGQPGHSAGPAWGPDPAAGQPGPAAWGAAPGQPGRSAAQPGWGPGSAASGPGLPGQAGQWPAADGLPAHPARNRRKALHWTVGITAAVLLVIGAVLAGRVIAHRGLAGQSLAGTAAPASGQAATGPSGQAALLNTALDEAASPGTPAAAPGVAAPGAGAPARGPAPARAACRRAARAARAARLAGHPLLARGARLLAARCRLIRRRVIRFLLVRGVDGQFTFTTPRGERTLAYQRGVITSVTPGSRVTVTDANGVTWTWDLVTTTVVRQAGGRATTGSLSAGEPVWVGGPVTSGVRDARLIFVRPPAASFAGG